MGSALLSIGVRAMAASYAQMQTTGHNIANASVDGYSRQRVNLATSQGQFSGVGFLGRGVDVVSIERLQDSFLTREAASTKSLSAMDGVRAQRMAQLEQVFSSGEQGIGNSINQLFAAFSDLASRPADGATRQVALSRAQDLVLRFNDAGARLGELQTTVNQELASSVSEVNALASSIAKINQDIAAVRGLGQAPNDLLDERERLLSRLSEHVQVSTIAAEDGTVGVFMGGGEKLVLGTRAETLELTPDLYDNSRSSISMREGSTLRPLGADSLGGGRMLGLLQFQDQDLTAAFSLFGQLGRALAGAINTQQQLGLNLQPPAGSVESRPLFGFNDATLERVLPASTNDRDGSGNYTSDVTIEVTDPSQLRATEYELRGDPDNAGQWILEHVPADGSAPVPVVDGQEVDGFIVRFNSGPTTGDRFRLQPVTQAAVGLQRLLSDPLDLAAASPFVASAATGNTGTAQVGSLRMLQTPTDWHGTATLTVVGPDPVHPERMQYTWDLQDALGASIGSGSGTWIPGQAIPAAGDADINGFALMLSGVPATGDVFTLQPTPYPATNNGNALALNSLGTTALVGRDELPDGSVTGGLSFSETYVAALADVGVRARGATTAASISEARAASAEAARADKSGVNLDEEAARLIQYQQAYQAAAKVLQIAQQVFNNLLDIAR
ncbi:MAG: flagellar hook-associated protein FlgK [Rubrivivax sp.]